MAETRGVDGWRWAVHGAVLGLLAAASAIPSTAATASPGFPSTASPATGQSPPRQEGSWRNEPPVDGIAAVVNDEVISVGEVRRAALLLREIGADRPAGGCGSLGPEAARFGASPDAVTGDDPDTAELEAARECLIDGTLVFREARRFPQLDITREEVAAAFQRLRDTFPDDATFRRELERFGLTPEGLRQDLRRQLLVAAYVENRFRATVDVDEAAARAYYRDELVPQMEREGIDPPPYERVADEYVLPILREREVNRRVESWLQDLRARATIRRLYPGPDTDS